MYKAHPLFSSTNEDLRCCPQCKKSNGRVYSSRKQPSGERDRRLKCKSCGYVWSIGVSPTGSLHRLSTANVRHILTSDKPVTDLATLYKVSYQLISMIKNGDIYKDFCKDIQRGKGLNCLNCVHHAEARCTLGIPEAKGRLTWARFCSCFCVANKPKQEHQDLASCPAPSAVGKT